MNVEQAESGSDSAVDEAADRAAYLEEIAGAAKGDSGEPKKKSTVSQDEESGEGAVDDDDGDSEESDAEEDSDGTDSERPDSESEEDDDSDEDGDEPDADQSKDPDTDKRLAAVQKAERRSKERVDRDKAAALAEVEAKRNELLSEWKPKVEKAERFERLAQRVRTHTVEVLLELGITEDDLEFAAQQVYAHSKAASVKPEHRAAAQQAARDRESRADQEATRRELDELKAKLESRDQEAAARASYERYMANVEKAAGKTTPLVARALAQNPSRARQRITEIALKLFEELGGEPPPARVLAAYEKARRAELEEDGVDVDALLKQPSKAKQTKAESASAADESGVKSGTPAKKSQKGNEKQRVAKTLSEDEEREQILSELRAMSGS